jgi:uracil-DNA glycosylase family 4
MIAEPKLSGYLFDGDDDSDATFEHYSKGVDEYKDVSVIQGPTCHYNCVRSYGSMSSGVVFVGISPARDEVTRSKRPLTGPSGELLNASLSALGMDRKDYYCTNLVCTWMDDPTTDDISQCSERLDFELKTLKPKFIVLLGKLVGEHFTGRPFGKVRGAVQWSEEYNAYVMVTYHPSAILRSMQDYGSSKDSKASVMIYDFIRDIRKLQDVVNWAPSAPEAQVRYRVVTAISDAQNVLDNLPRHEDFPIALDVETTYNKDNEEVEVFKDDLLCVGVGSENFCWVFTPSALYDSEGTPALNWPTGIWWTMHNSIFDSQVMRRKLGVWTEIKEDTMLQSYSLDERSGVHKLKLLAREYLAAGFYEDDRFYGKMKLDEIPKPMLYEYNAKDVVYTARLTRKFKTWQVADDVRDFYLNILIPAINMYKETQYHGVNIDMTAHLKFTWEWGHRILAEEQALRELVESFGGDPNINFSAPDQVSMFIFGILGLPCTKYTKGGKPSVDKEVLESLREQHEFIPKLESLRRLYKMWSTYIISLPEKLKVDGRAHPIVKLHGTATGRPSYTDLAVQTFVAPSAPHEFNQMRTLICAPPFEGYEGTDGYECPEDEEYVIVEVDFGKAELWVAQSYSEDQQMLADLLSGDYHTNVAMDIYQKSRDQITGDDRTWAKRTSFGILYDIEEETLGKLTKSHPLDARDRIDRWNRRNADYHKWALSIQRQIKATGELVSKTGRKRRIIILGSAIRAIKQAINYPIQSTSSDVVLKSAVQMHPRIKRIGGHVLFTVHDSIVTKALKSRLQEHCQIMHDVMIANHFEGVKSIPVEVKVGSNWGTVKGVHDCTEKLKPSPYSEYVNLENICNWWGKHVKEEVHR